MHILYFINVMRRRGSNRLSLDIIIIRGVFGESNFGPLLFLVYAGALTRQKWSGT
jgi:hypothetical protein